jgi:hypothetical protein
MKQENLILERLTAFGESKGGFSEIGRTIGKHPAVFYNLRVRNAKPSVDTLEEIAKHYPELNFDWLITGRGNMILSDDLNKIELSRLKRENQLLQIALELKGVSLSK